MRGDGVTTRRHVVSKSVVVGLAVVSVLAVAPLAWLAWNRGPGRPDRGRPATDPTQHAAVGTAQPSLRPLPDGFVRPWIRLHEDGTYRWVRSRADAHSWAAVAAPQMAPYVPLAADMLSAPPAVRAAVAALHAQRRSHGAWDQTQHEAHTPDWVAARLRHRDSWNTVAAWWSESHLRWPTTPDVNGSQPATPTPCSRTIVSFSTIPSRISRLGKLLRALKWQAVQPDEIAIGVPPIATRLRQQYTIPDGLLRDPWVHIVHLPVDYGPLSKLVAGLLATDDPNACIIT